jgi:pimeloyl-ACP methyl ester carboxylesterase
VPAAQVDGARLWYCWTGTGEVVVHVHGGGLGHQNFDRLTPLIAERYRVLDLDLRGYGDSDRPDQEYSLRVWSDDVAALMETLGIDRAHLHGTSTGGLVALQFAADHPERLRSLILTCTAGKLDYAAWLTFEVWVRIMEAYGLENETLAMLLALQGFTPDFLDREGPATVETIRATSARACSPKVFISACRELQRADFTGVLPHIAVPTLVLTGADDRMTPVDVGPSGIGSRRLAELIPGARLVLLPNAGHTHLFQQPRESADAIVSFLAEVGVAVAGSD